MLEWVSIYWFSRAGPTAAGRIYYEMRDGGVKSIVRTPGWSSIPFGISYFPKEIANMKLYVPYSPSLRNVLNDGLLPLRWSRGLGNVVFEAKHDTGGHFAAHEVPEKLAGDLRKMFSRNGPAYGVVPGKSGYDA